MTVGRFQPFTQGHLNMINEGDAPCIVYQIKPAEIPDNLSNWKISGKKVSKKNIKAALDYVMNSGEGSLTDTEKEILKRPFTNELISKELDIVKRNNKNIIDIVYVRNMYEGLARFNKFILDNADKYEPQYLMCGDDRVDSYSELIDKYDTLIIDKGGEEFENVLKGKLKTNVGKGRTEGVSGTDVRLSIIKDDKLKFDKIMPQGVGVMFDEFKEAFKNLVDRLSTEVKERKLSLVEYIREQLEQ